MNHNLLCFKYKGRPDEEQLSDSPAIDDANVEWFHVKAYPSWNEWPLREDQKMTEYKTPDGGTWRPLSECPDRCNDRGWCQIRGSNYQGWHEDPNERWCNCHSYYEGKACEIASPYHCYRNCSGVGTCLGGWCHCQPGYWGHGCTRRKAYTSSVGWRPDHAQIKIYVYDLPTIIAHRREFNDQWCAGAYIDLMYNAELEFTEQLLGDWAVRTENPWEAALFYVPMFTYWYTGNIGHPYFIIQHVTHWLQQLGPFFNATGGRNHIMWATNDRGVCKLQHAPLEMQHSIKMVHFGQAPRRPYTQKSHLSGGGMLPLVSALPLPGRRFDGFPDFNAADILEENEICLRPEKDVVAPNYLHKNWVEPGMYEKVWKVQVDGDGSRRVARRPGVERPVTLFFGGYVKDSMVYSQGVRQAIHKMFGPGGKYDPNGPNARPDWKIGGPSGQAADEMQKAKFCLAPMGAGWGIRLGEAMVTGCVPVIVQDHVYQPLWDVLPFEEFSLRLGRTEVANLVELLDAVTPQQLEALQVGLEKYHRAFIWETQFGGLAYNYTLTALKRKALHLWSVNYRRSSRRAAVRRRRQLMYSGGGDGPRAETTIGGVSDVQ
ncbi:hypothetical protein GPECTOR_17g940 [Gonium pectorale]|uniref:EGF-like domain-containing protein n=1 Tax=Gonium pectorale TaxID=33097 RepID=A0A150GKI2_GONPE|nr:hypothetical protein GPECTOR_17g940 [Gonium pectorale]|eukprot:KXZ50301.1 hypothetical protein GPECTOR_17g940 [Gonium pectorale]